jgi:EAL domain-containing protein (putative c-di-GMP-specific phosphodiesterase class I)
MALSQVDLLFRGVDIRVLSCRRYPAGIREKFFWSNMLDQISALLDQQSFIPHGHCYLWMPEVLWLHVMSDAVIAAAYFSIPFALRMRDESGELVPPMAFIPAAERYGLMPQLDRRVISTAFLQYEKSNLPHRMSCICTINLSGAFVCDDNFYDFVVEQFSLYKISPRGICFEITETSPISNLPQAMVLIRKLKDLGCRFALDDFGSGLSSFTYLKHLPVDYLKIDGGFVKDMVEDPIDHAMVEAINHIGHVMQIKTIAECVENGAILAALRDIGVNFAQGYGIERPSLSVLSAN